jgi:ribosomal protein S18 acetylase RimI-like enzyme
VQYTITQATPHDEEALWQMLYYAAWMELDGATSYHPALEDPHLRDYVTEWGALNDIGVIARDGERVIGAAWARPVLHADETAMMTIDDGELAIALVPDCRGRGVGTTLLACLCALADVQGMPLVLTVREHNPAIVMYQHAGFETQTTIQNRVGGTSFVMRRKSKS